MGLLDTVLGSLMGGAGGSSSPMQGVLMNMLGGGQGGRRGDSAYLLECRDRTVDRQRWHRASHRR